MQQATYALRIFKVIHIILKIEIEASYGVDKIIPHYPQAIGLVPLGDRAIPLFPIVQPCDEDMT